MALSRAAFVEAVGSTLFGKGKSTGKKTETYTKTHPDTTKYAGEAKKSENTTKVNVAESAQYKKDTGESME